MIMVAGDTLGVSSSRHSHGVALRAIIAYTYLKSPAVPLWL